MKTKQIDFWAGEFGKEYTNRNTHSQQEWHQSYIEKYGASKIDLNNRLIADLPKDAKILEVGCNTGHQLAALREQGFTNLYGIELQWYAVEKAKEHLQHINILQGSGFDLPFKDNYFDLVCTNGVLIHIAPDDLPIIMAEIYRCSKKYIMGFEYYAPKLTSIHYRGNDGFMWKADYADIYLQNKKDLSLVKKEIVPYIWEQEKGNEDILFLLEK